MIWLVAAGLALWCLLQQLRLTSLGDELKDLRQKLARVLADTQPREQRPEAPAAPAPEARPAPPPAPPVVAPPPVTAPLAPARVEPERRSAPPRAPRPSISDWLSRNGLAWIGGGALALGGLMLVAYAAEHGFFTPILRIWAATVIGILALAAGEWLRRFRGENSPGLEAALTTAAGAAILYAAIWAAQALYHFIPVELAAILLATVSLGLLGLALLHGEALGLLAVAAAYAVPLVVSRGSWAGDALLDAYVDLILATGLAAAGLRRWRRVAALTLAGAGVWALIRLVSNDSVGAAIIAGAAPYLTLGSNAFARRRVEADATVDRAAGLVTAAVIGASVIGALLWRDLPPGPDHVYAAIVIALAAAATTIGSKLRLSRPALLAAPAATVFVCAVVCSLPMARSFALPWLLADIAAIALAGLASGLLERPAAGRPPTATLIGAGAGALGLTTAAPALTTAFSRQSPAVDLGFALLFALSAVVLSRRPRDTRTDLGLAAFIAASAEAVGLAIHAGLDGQLAPTAYGALAALLAVLSLATRWRGFAESAAIAALAAFAALLGPAETAAALLGRTDWIRIALVAAGAVVAQTLAWRLLKARGDVVGSTEAISTLAILSGLLGGFLVVQRWSAPAPGAVTLDGFTAGALRTVLVLAAGLTLSLRGAATPLGRWRGPVFLALGALHGVLVEGLVLHPWWGLGAPVAGPPVLDTIALGLLAPGLLLAAAAARWMRGERRLVGPGFAAALVFLGLWAVTEVRRLFHGPSLAPGGFSYAEVAAYGGGLLLVAVGLATVRARSAKDPGDDAGFEAVGCGGLAIGVLIFGWAASPWWGPLDGDLRDPLLLAALYGLAIGCAGWIAHLARTARWSLLARAALLAAGAQLFALITLAVRYGFHGAAMRAPLREASLETWTFSAVWALYGLIVLAWGAGRRDIALRGLGLAILLATTLKVFLFDLARLEGVARAASFLALGVVLLLGALAARRLGAGPVERSEASHDPPSE